jgi:hypothetical protein
MAEYTLTNEEKNNIIITHLRTLAFQKYNLEVSILEENASDQPNQDNLTSYTSQVDVINKKIERLEAESSSLTA